MAEAEHERFTSQAETIRESGKNLDAEHEVLQRLTELRKAIAKHVASAKQASEASQDIGALRSAIASVFECVYVRPAEHPITDLEGYADTAEQIEGGAYWVEPRLRESMIVSREQSGTGRAILHEVPIHFEGLHISTGRGVPE